MSPVLEAVRVTGAEAARGALGLGPAGAAARDLAADRVVPHTGVEPQSGDDHEGVARVRVDREPLALAPLAPAHERARVERAAGQEAGAAQRVGHGAGAVVARILDLAVAAAVLVRLADDLVGRVDRAHDLGWR